MGSINRGAFKTYEGWVASQVRQGKSVEVEVRLIYKDASNRPSGIEYITTIDGETRTKIFGN
jgi:hypothetical protein